MIGIYKIISPSGRIYIGQSINIPYRFSTYKRLDCNSQRRLYQSFNKYGVSNHVFEVVEYCERNRLNELELFYINKFNCLSKYGLNCCLIGTKNMISDCTREKMRSSAKNRPSPMIDKKHTDEARAKMSASKKGKPGWRKGIKLAPESILLLRSYQLGVKQSDKSKQKRRQWNIDNDLNCKKIIDTSTGLVYDSIKKAALCFNIKPNTLNAMLTGQNKNKTTLTYFKN